MLIFSKKYGTMKPYINRKNNISKYTKNERNACMDTNINNQNQKRYNILAIDDNVLLLRTVKEMLSASYQVAIATSGSQAFDQIAIRTPDLILLDYEMPYQNGGELFKKIKSDPALAGIPVIFFTGSSDLDTVTKLLSLKPDGYLLKPPSKTKLVALIEKTLHKI